MNEKTFEITENARVTIEECTGDLSIKSDDTNQFTVKVPGGEESLVYDQDGNIINLTIKDDCRIICPPATTLNLIKVRGDLKVKGITGAIKIGAVNGDTDLRGIGEVILDAVSGDLRVKTAAGGVEVNNIAGDARLQDITGPAKLGNVGADLRAGNLMQGLAAGAVGSDARLEPPFMPGETYRVTAGSDLIVMLPEEPNLRFTITAGGHVKSNVPEVEFTKEGGTASAILGEGAAHIQATVGGSAVIRSSSEPNASFGEDFDFDFDPGTFDFLEDLGPMIESSVSQAMSQMDMHLQEGMKYFDSDEFKAKMDKVGEKVRRMAAKVEQKSEGIAERARQQAEHAAERARMRADQAERRWQRASGQRTSPPSPAAPSAPTTDDKREERLGVLRMVEEGKITADEAAKLLSALR